MEFFANAGAGMLLLAFFAVIFTLLYVFQRQYPLLNRILGFCLIFLGIAIALIWAKDGEQLRTDPFFKIGLLFSIVGAMMLAFADSMKSD